MKKKKYELTEEHRKELKPWADMWTKIIMSTKKMTDEERTICTKATKGLYRAGGFKELPDDKIIYVSSPFVARFAAGIATAIYEGVIPNLEVTANTEFTFEIMKAVNAATGKDIAIKSGKYKEDSKTRWYKFPANSLQTLLADLGLEEAGRTAIKKAYSMFNGGNFWGQYVSFLTFFRYIVKLNIDYTKFDHYERLARHSSVRFMHEKFCIISDRPQTLLTSKDHRPHCIDGPFCEWRDGTALFALNGTYMEEWMVTTPTDILDYKKVLKIENVEQRAELVKKIGVTKLFKYLSNKVLDTQDEYKLYSVDFAEGVYPERIYLRMQNPSVDDIHIEAVHPDCKTVKQALAWRNTGKMNIPYQKPLMLT